MKSLRQLLLPGTDDSKPFIIAEMSGNHNCSLDKALEIVDAAAETGADAIKIQTFSAESMTLDLAEGEFSISDRSSLWYGSRLYDLYEKAKTPREWHKPIFERAKEKGILCFSSPFDDDAIDFLETLDVPVYKIASFEMVDLPLIRRAASTGKPLIISTGMASIEEISEAVNAALGVGCENLTLLKCTSSYPATPENTNLMTMPLLAKMFGCNVGISDHTLGIGVSVGAVALGANVIEKHFILDRGEGGVDSAFSLEPLEFKSLVDESHKAGQSLGHVHFGGTESEMAGRKKRRSLYIGEDMMEGEILTPKNLRRIRPGNGLPPKYFEELLGRKVGRDVEKGTPMSWSILSK